jgi:hypothetical protein
MAISDLVEIVKFNQASNIEDSKIDLAKMFEDALNYRCISTDAAAYDAIQTGSFVFPAESLNISNVEIADNIKGDAHQLALGLRGFAAFAGFSALVVLAGFSALGSSNGHASFTSFLAFCFGIIITVPSDLGFGAFFGFDAVIAAGFGASTGAGGATGSGVARVTTDAVSGSDTYTGLTSSATGAGAAACSNAASATGSAGCFDFGASAIGSTTDASTLYGATSVTACSFLPNNFFKNSNMIESPKVVFSRLL